MAISEREQQRWRAVGTMVDKIALTDILTALSKARGTWQQLEYVTLGGTRRNAGTPMYLIIRGRFRRQTSWVALAFAVARLLGKPFDGIDGVDNVELGGLDTLEWKAIKTN